MNGTIGGEWETLINNKHERMCVFAAPCWLRECRRPALVGLTARLGRQHLQGETQTAVSSAGMYLRVHPVRLPGRDKSFMGLEGEVEIWHESRLWGWVGCIPERETARAKTRVVVLMAFLEDSDGHTMLGPRASL